MNNAAASYFHFKFELSIESAAAIASIFGWMNLFARGIGGYVSDKLNTKMGMRGRLLWQGINLILEGIMVFIFANSHSLGIAIFVLVIFSLFVQSAEGSTYGIGKMTTYALKSREHYPYHASHRNASFLLSSVCQSICNRNYHWGRRSGR